MPHGAGFYILECAKCGHIFEWPSLGDMTYGEILLHGELGTVHRYVCVLDHPVWNAIDTVLRAREPEGSDLWWDVLATLADPVDGQRLQVGSVCPRCGTDRSRCPAGMQKQTPRIGEVEDATFAAFLKLPEDEQLKRIRREAQRH